MLIRGCYCCWLPLQSHLNTVELGGWVGEGWGMFLRYWRVSSNNQPICHVCDRQKRKAWLKRKTNSTSRKICALKGFDLNKFTSKEYIVSTSRQEQTTFPPKKQANLGVCRWNISTNESHVLSTHPYSCSERCVPAIWQLKWQVCPCLVRFRSGEPD